MSQIEHGQYNPHDGPPVERSALDRILSIEWPPNLRPENFDTLTRIIEVVRDLKQEKVNGGSVVDTQQEM